MENEKITTDPPICFTNKDDLINHTAGSLLEKLTGLTPYEIDQVFDRIRTIIREDTPIVFQDAHSLEKLP